VWVFPIDFSGDFRPPNFFPLPPRRSRTDCIQEVKFLFLNNLEHKPSRESLFSPPFPFSFLIFSSAGDEDQLPVYPFKHLNSFFFPQKPGGSHDYSGATLFFSVFRFVESHPVRVHPPPHVCSSFPPQLIPLVQPETKLPLFSLPIFPMAPLFFPFFPFRSAQLVVFLCFLQSPP